MGVLFSGDGPKAMMTGVEVGGRVDEMPKVKELVERIVGEAKEIIRGMPERFTTK